MPLERQICCANCNAVSRVYISLIDFGMLLRLILITTYTLGQFWDIKYFYILKSPNVYTTNIVQSYGYNRKINLVIK